MGYLRLEHLATDLLFVYGTLMRGGSAPLSRVLEEQAEFLGDAVVAGRIYSLGRYPGFTDHLDPSDLSIVRGEVFRIKQPDLWGTLDDFEGAEYERVVRRTIIGVSGQECDVWIYRYAGVLDGQPRILSGDWRAQGQ